MKTHLSRRSHRLSALLYAFVLAACGSDAAGPRVSTVAVTPTSPSVVIGLTTQLTATARDGSGTVITGRPVTWSSEAEGVATVSGSGLVTGLAQGTARITAVVDGQSGSVTVTVTLPPVVTVTITPLQPTAQVGGTVQLTATMRDVGGAILTGRQVNWASQNPMVATVDAASGLVTGVGPGTAQVTATSEGVTESVQVSITALPGSVVIQSVTPALLIEGSEGVISGTGFSAEPTQNVVTIDGIAAQITSSTATTITFTVPSSGCHPARSNAAVRVLVGGDAAQVSHSVRPAEFTTFPVGELTLLSGSAEYCLQLEGGTTTQGYVIGVQSVSATPASRTPVTVRGLAGTGGSAQRPADASLVAGGVVDPVQDRHTLRRLRHRDAELVMRQHERTFASRLFNTSRTTSSLGRLMAATVPGTVNVGDTVNVRFPDPNDLCNTFTLLRTVVRHKGTRGIWVEDVDNPQDGFTPADFASLGGMLDNEIWTTNSTYLGTPTDRDSNQRVVIVITKEINKRENLLGFVTSGDFFPECAASNNGEYYYGIAPDPAGTFGSVYTTADALIDAPALIAHEFAHVIQFGRRLETPGATSFPTLWEAEGQAMLAEEVVGHAFIGNTIGQNYGFATAFNEPAMHPISWYETSFIYLAVYYGFLNSTTKAVGAPEQCGWLGRPSDDDSLGPCIPGASLYGVSWSFLRWLSDQYGPTYPGGEAAMHRAFVADTRVGFATIAGVVGRPIDELLAQWAASLYLDDRFSGLNARLGFTSWNLPDIESRLVTPARLSPRRPGFAGFSDALTVIAGSSAYYHLTGANRPNLSLSFTGTGGGALPATTRVWIVRVQ
jgi:hypothetical protein